MRKDEEMVLGAVVGLFIAFLIIAFVPEDMRMEVLAYYSVGLIMAVIFGYVLFHTHWHIGR